MHGQALHLHLQVNTRPGIAHDSLEECQYLEEGQYKDRHCAFIPWQYGEAEIGLAIACPMLSGQVLNSVEGVFPSLSRTFSQSDYANGSGDQHRI
jgi:hypothetical protein